MASSMNQERSMSEREVIARTREPITVMTLVTLEACGLRVGQTVLVHTRLSVLGWVVGGAQAVIQDLLQVLGPTDADPDVEESRSVQWCARAGARSVMAQNAQKRIKSGKYLTSDLRHPLADILARA
jgi:hypothetical protein